MCKSRQFYLNNIHKGNIIAFTVMQQGEQIMLSGRVKEVAVGESLVVQTRNGSIFFPKLNDVVWVKTGTRWPIGVYNALKYQKGSEEL